MKYASTINPFYAARQYRPASELPAEPYQPILVRLPRAPVNASPVPTLTSLYHFDRAGEYGDRSYPGNCGGNLIRDLLRYFKPQNSDGPNEWKRHLPRRLPGTGHRMRIVRHSPRHRRLRSQSVFWRGPTIRAALLRFRLAASALLAPETLLCGGDDYVVSFTVFRVNKRFRFVCGAT